MANSYSTIGCPDIDLEPLTTSISGIDTKCDTIITDVGAVDTTVNTINTNVNTVNTNVNTVNTNVNTINTNVNTIDSLVDALTIAVATINSTVNTINSNNPGGGGGGSAKFVSIGQASGNPPSGKTWVCFNRTLQPTQQQSGSYGSVAGWATSINTGSGFVNQAAPSGSAENSRSPQYTMQYDNA
tara:strand:- start:1471 stop:2025 length:555 start_codon:yes stop_codon:yes gene_type:complete